MTASMILFGLNLIPLFNAIATVESNRGATSENVYQIRRIYVRDVNRIYGLRGDMAYNYGDVNDKAMSEMMMFLYWKHYAYATARNTGRRIDYELLARLHNGGPSLALTHATDGYWNRVKAQLRKEGIE